VERWRAALETLGDAVAEDDSADATREEERQAQEAGIHAVPTFVFDGRFAMSGAQHPAALAQAVRQALSAAST